MFKEIGKWIVPVAVLHAAINVWTGFSLGSVWEWIPKIVYSAAALVVLTSWKK